MRAVEPASERSPPCGATRDRGGRARSGGAIVVAVWLGSAAALVPACTGESYLVVTVENQPAVHGASTLRVELSNAGASITHDFALNSAFPVTFSVSAPGRTGELALRVDALDAAGLLVGRGALEAPLATEAVRLVLNTVDFVVNTDFDESQFPSNDFEAHGFQLGATAEGTWTVAYRSSCATPCSMQGRRFDGVGRPLTSEITGSTNSFSLSTRPTTSAATPAIAGNATTTLAVWDFFEPSPGTDLGIACRTLDPAGRANASESLLATDPSPDVVSIVALADENFAVSWSSLLTDRVIRSVIVRPDCTTTDAARTVSELAGTIDPHRGAIGANRTGILHAWLLDGDVRVRGADLDGASTTDDLGLVAKTATESVEHVRVAGTGESGFAVVVRWALSSGASGPGRIELYRVSDRGEVSSPPILITERSGSDFESSQSFGVTARPDGTVLVVWHACGEHGDGSGCGVFGRVIDASATAPGDELVLATTTEGDQTNPSAAALPDGFAVTWQDASGAPPDRSGTAVRARVIYPEASGAAAARVND